MYTYTHMHTHSGALRYYLSHDKTKGRDSLFSFLRGHIASFLPSEPENVSFTFWMLTRLQLPAG